MKQAVQFRAIVSYVPGEVVLTMFGEIDMSTGPTFAGATRAMDGGPGVTLVFDMTGVTFIDSTALTIIAGTLRRLQASGGRLCIRGASPMMCRLFEITGIDKSEVVEIIGLVSELPPTGTAYS